MTSPLYPSSPQINHEVPSTRTDVVSGLAKSAPSRTAERGRAHRILHLPFVYRPQDDTWLLAEAMAGSCIAAGARVLDACTGTGALAVAAAERGASQVTAVDVSRLAVANAWINARWRRLRVQVRRMNVVATPPSGTYDVVLANPPYVPCDGVRRRADRHSVAWDAGADGRATLDALCDLIPHLLAPGGIALIVQSTVCGVDQSTERLRRGGLETAVVARRVIGFGPVMHSRTDYLERSGLIDAGQRHEELVVIRGRRPTLAK